MVGNRIMRLSCQQDNDSSPRSLVGDHSGGSMSLIETYGKELVSAIVPFAIWTLNRLLRPRAKLLLAQPHTFTFLVEEPLRDEQGNIIKPTQTVHIMSLLLKNDGTETAKNVELVFNWKPPCLNIWPQRYFTERFSSDKRYAIIFESLAPNEVIGCELFSVNFDLPGLIYARSDQCVAQSISMYPQPVAKPWKIRIFAVFSFAGLGLLIYLLLLLLQFLVLRFAH
jgi:hypothetical protein